MTAHLFTDKPARGMAWDLYLANYKQDVFLSPKIENTESDVECIPTVPQVTLVVHLNHYSSIYSLTEILFPFSVRILKISEVPLGFSKPRCWSVSSSQVRRR